MVKEIVFYDVFELNRVLHILMEQQLSYNVGIAYKIYKLIEWLDSTELFVMGRIKMATGDSDIDLTDDVSTAILSMQIPFDTLGLRVEDIINPTENVMVQIADIDVIERIFKVPEN